MILQKQWCWYILCLIFVTASKFEVCSCWRDYYSRREPAASTGVEIFNASSNLLKALFTGYLDSIPRNENSSPIPVRVNAQILRLLDVDELRQVLSFSAKVTIEWHDNRLRWNPADYANLSRIEVPSSVAIWWPDVTWLERLEVDFTWRSQGRVVVKSNGLLTLSSQVTMNINCYMDPGYFPFDSHRCTVSFEPLVHTKDAIVLQTRLYEGIHNQSLINDQWICGVLTNECSSTTHVYVQDASQTAEFSENICTIKLRRRSLYHIFNLFLPATVITFMVVFAFLIPPNEPDMKIQFGLSILLQLIVFLMYIYDSLPVSATQIPLLSMYFALCLFMAAISCILVVVIAYVNWLGEDNINVPDWVEKVLLRKIGPYLVKRHMNILDRPHMMKHRSSTASAPSAQHDTSGMTNSRNSGIFRLGRISVPPSVLSDPVLTPASDAAATQRKSQLQSSDDENPEIEKMLPADDPNANAGASSTRVHFNGKQDAEAGASSTDVRRKRSQPDADLNSIATGASDHEWNMNKVKWSLVALVLDRLCAIVFLCVYLIIIVVILAIGYANISSKF